MPVHSHLVAEEVEEGRKRDGLGLLNIRLKIVDLLKRREQLAQSHGAHVGGLAELLARRQDHAVVAHETVQNLLSPARCHDLLGERPALRRHVRCHAILRVRSGRPFLGTGSDDVGADGLSQDPMVARLESVVVSWASKASGSTPTAAPPRRRPLPPDRSDRTRDLR